MTKALDVFTDLVLNDLLPTFCNDPSRNFGCDGFKIDSIKITELDASNFLRALDAGLIKSVRPGLYRAEKSKASEQLFWTGRSDKTPRTVTLWIEPIITIATLARLHFEYGWPRELIGTQSAKWEFDVTTFAEQDINNEYIACEVKKSISELDQLVTLMQEYASKKPLLGTLKYSKEINAYRKLEGLKARRASVFWAVGPDGVGHVFNVSYKTDGTPNLRTVSDSALNYPGIGPWPTSPLMI